MKVEVLKVAKYPAFLDAKLNAAFTIHDLTTAGDPDAFIAGVAPNVRGLCCFGSSVVRMGSTVTYRPDNGPERTVQLVYPADADIDICMAATFKVPNGSDPKKLMSMPVKNIRASLDIRIDYTNFIQKEHEFNPDSYRERITGII